MNEEKARVNLMETTPPPKTNSAASTICAATCSEKAPAFKGQGNFDELDANAVCIKGTT
jgi:hypothetical protein